MKAQVTLEALVSLAAFLAFVFLLASSLQASSAGFSGKNSFMQAKASAVSLASVSDFYATNVVHGKTSFYFPQCATPVVYEAKCVANGETGISLALGVLNESLQPM